MAGEKHTPMYQRYGIGAIAKLLGLSAESIRYYETRGIIQPIRDPETGYRYYNAWDFHMLLRARHYQSYGFSLGEIADLFRKERLSDIATAVEDQEDQIQHEILWQVNKLRRIRQSQAMIRDAQQNAGKFRIEQSPGIYRINTQVEYTFCTSAEERALIEAWAGMAPFVYSCAVFYEERLRQGHTGFDFGMGVNEEYAGLLGIHEGDGVQYYPPRVCLHTCLPSRSGAYLTSNSLEPAFAYMREHGLELGGDIVTQVACMVKPGEEYFNWHRVWIPLKNIADLPAREQRPQATL